MSGPESCAELINQRELGLIADPFQCLRQISKSGSSRTIVGATRGIAKIQSRRINTCRLPTMGFKQRHTVEPLRLEYRRGNLPKGKTLCVTFGRLGIDIL